MTLTPKKAFGLTKPVQLRVNGQSPSGLQDTSGRLIDGDHNATAGGNGVALLRRGGVTVSSVVSVHSDNVRDINPIAIDVLLRRGDMAELGSFRETVPEASIAAALSTGPVGSFEGSRR